MLDVKAALTALRKAAPKAKVKKEVSDTIEHVSASLASLTPLSLPRDIDRLTLRLRGPLVPLYKHFTLPALRLAAAILDQVCNKNILPYLNPQDQATRRPWESVAHAILSGVLDFIDSNHDDQTKENIATIFYPTICKICLSSDILRISALSVTLRTTAYMLLADTTASHPKNQETLRDPKVLGGKRLGCVLYNTKDYLALETLLNVLARIVPGSDRGKRSRFLQQVFVSRSHECGTELVRLMENVSAADWDKTAMMMVDALARADISYPQPFALDVVHACGTRFPQPTASDRLYVDREAFFVNVADENDAYESLQMSYSSVREIRLTPGSDSESIRVTVFLSSPPAIAEEPMRVAQDAALTSTFDLENKNVDRFVKALESRSLGGLITRVEKRSTKPVRISLTQSSARLEFTDEGDPVRDPHTFQDKVKTVEKLYRTNELSDDMIAVPESTGLGEPEAIAFDELINYPTTPLGVPSKVTKDESSKASKPVSVVKETIIVDSSVGRSATGHPESVKVDNNLSPCSANVATDPPTPVSNPQKSMAAVLATGRTNTQRIREAVFGTSDDALSDISDADTVPWKSKPTGKPEQSVGSKPLSTAQRNEPKTGLTKRQQSTDTTIARPVGTTRKGRCVLDSDDEDRPLSPVHAAKNTVKKKKATTEESEESETEETAIKQNRSRSDSNLAVLEPQTEPSSDMTLVSSKNTGGIPQTEDTNVSSIKDMNDGNQRIGTPAETSSTLGSKLASGHNTTSPSDAPSSVIHSVPNGSATGRVTRSSAFATVKGTLTGSTSYGKGKDVAGSSKQDNADAVLECKAGKLQEVSRSARRSARIWEPSLDLPAGSGTTALAGDLVFNDNESNTDSKKIAAAPDLTAIDISAPAVPKRKGLDSDYREPGNFVVDGATSEERPVKRLRGQIPQETAPCPQVTAGARATVARPTKKYGNRGKITKASSPLPSRLSLDIDLDAVPTLSSDPIINDPSSPVRQIVEKAAKASESKRQNEPVVPAARTTRAAAMKARDNKLRAPAPLQLTAVENKSSKGKIRNKRVASPSVDDVQELMSVVPNKDPEHSAHNKLSAIQPGIETPKRQIVDEKAMKKDSMSVEDAANIERRGNNKVPLRTPEPPVVDVVKGNEDENQLPEQLNFKPKKPKKAPWETDKFSDMIKQQQSSSPSSSKTVKGGLIQDDVQTMDEDIQPAIANASVMDNIDLSISPVRKSFVSVPEHGESSNYEVDVPEGCRRADSTFQSTESLKELAKVSIDKAKEVVEGITAPRAARQSVRLPVTSVSVDDVEMIDLTGDDSPVKKSNVKESAQIRCRVEVSSPTRSRVNAPIGTSASFIPVAVIESAHKPSPQMSFERVDETLDFGTFLGTRTPVPNERLIAASKNLPGKTRNKVTFATDVKQEFGSPFEVKKGYLTSAFTKEKAMHGSTRRTAGSKRTSTITEDDEDEIEVETREPGIQDIVDVLNEIQETIVRKLSNKVEGVRANVRVGRSILLQDAAADLQIMRNESVYHFNRLIDLEAEYAGYGRKVNDGWEDMLKINEEIQEQLRQTIQDHDRNSLVKKMPKTLFAMPLPTICQKFCSRSS